MRYGLLVLGIAICIGLYQGWFAQTYEHVTTAALTDDGRIAIDLGCRGHKDRAARACRSRLTRLYLSGSLDPEKTLRAYCDSVRDGRWGGSHPPPPKVCVERHGGWQES
jgi:hypothetical protein